MGTVGSIPGNQVGYHPGAYVCPAAGVGTLFGGNVLAGAGVGTMPGTHVGYP